MTDTPDLRTCQHFWRTVESNGTWVTRCELCGESKPALPELLERAKDHVMTDEEKEAQRQSWVRGEMGMDEGVTRISRGGEPDEPCYDTEAELLARGAQPEPDSPACVDEFDAQAFVLKFWKANGQPILNFEMLTRLVMAATAAQSNRIAELLAERARAGSSPAPKYIGLDPARGEAFTKYWCTLCGISDQACTHWVTGNEGKDEGSNGGDFRPATNSDATAGSHRREVEPAEVASPAVDWLDTELWNFAHGLAIDLGVDADHQTSEAEVKIHRAMAGVAKAYHYQQTRCSTEEEWN